MTTDKLTSGEKPTAQLKQQIAQLNYLHIAPRKVRLLAHTLRGLSVAEAEAQLLLAPQRSARPLLKLLRSAVANAKANQTLFAHMLVVDSISVDQGPILKRSLPRAMGRATPIHKKMSHVTLVLKETANPQAERFTIIPPIKEKKEEKKAKAQSESEKLKPVQPKGEREKKREERGFFKRFFRRKAI